MSISIIPGLGPQDLEGLPTPSGRRVPYFSEAYQSPLLDITQPLSGMEIIPAKVGYVPVLFRLGGSIATWVIESVTGTQTTPPTFRAGQNPNRNNIINQLSTTPTNTIVNSGVTPPYLSFVLSISAGDTLPLFANSPVFFDILSGAQGTGGYKCMAKLVLPVVWVAAGDLTP